MSHHGYWWLQQFGGKFVSALRLHIGTDNLAPLGTPGLTCSYSTSCLTQRMGEGAISITISCSNLDQGMNLK